MVSFDHMLFMLRIDDFNIDAVLIDGDYHFNYSFTYENNLCEFQTTIQAILLTKEFSQVTPEIKMKSDIIAMFDNFTPGIKVFGSIDFDDFQFPEIIKPNIIDLNDEIL